MLADWEVSLSKADGSVVVVGAKAEMMAEEGEDDGYTGQAWSGPGGLIRELGPEVVLVGWAGEH